MASKLLRSAVRSLTPLAPRHVLRSTTTRGFATVSPARDLGLVAPREVKEEATVTSLETGVRVASYDSASAVATVGVYIDAGARVQHKGGLATFVARSAFKASFSRSEYAVQRDLGAIGAKVRASADRSSVYYAGSAPIDNATDLLSLIADTVHNSRYRKSEIGQVHSVFANEVAESESSPSIQLDEALHAAVFGSKSLGQPLFPTKEELAALDIYSIQEYTDAFYTPARIVVVGNGISHDQLVRASKEFFSDSSFPPTRKAISPVPTPESTGSDVRVSRRGLSNASAVAIGFQNLPEKDSASLALRVFQTWLEGARYESRGALGGASAGGVAAHLVATRRDLTDTGLWAELPAGVLGLGAIGSQSNAGGVFGIGGYYADEAGTRAVVDALINALAQGVRGAVKGESLAVAKAQTIAQIYAERKPIARLDALAQQVLSGVVRSKSAEAAAVEAIDEAAVVAAVRKLVSQPVSVAAFGEVSAVPRYDLLAAQLAKALKA